MDDALAAELEGLRLDVVTLRTLIDLALDRGATGEDMLLQACSTVLRERRRRLERLERVVDAHAPDR